MTKAKKVFLTIPPVPNTPIQTVGERIQYILTTVREAGFYLLDDGLVSAEFRTVEPLAYTSEQLRHRSLHLQNLGRLLPALIQRTDKKCLVGSYSLKHTAESVMPVGSYVSNGEAILTMLFLGYTVVKTVGDTTPNCHFQCKLLPSDRYEGLAHKTHPIKETASLVQVSSPHPTTSPDADALVSLASCSIVVSEVPSEVPTASEESSPVAEATQ
jgi:hypothetical protein